jgi:hypothetical protein
MTNNRKALIANGLLILTGACLAILDLGPGLFITLGMGASLIYSGAANFCGFAIIFDRIESVLGAQDKCDT